MDLDILLGGPNRVLVVGAGKSGLAAARLCWTKSAQVTVTDKRDAASLESAIAALPEPCRRSIRWELGGHRAESFLETDLIVLSPGVPEIPELVAARKQGVPVTGEIELAARFVKAPLVGITGTNGKSTTTALAGEIARATGRPAFVGGNLGTPLADIVDTDAATVRGLAVVELSSYQLETADKLHPRAAALLNLTPDHLDRYGSMEAYGQAKLRIAQRMGPDDALVVNADDPFFVERGPRAAPHARHLFFSVKQPIGPRVHGAVSPDGAALVLAMPGEPVEEYPTATMQIIGRHNLANALAALLLMRGAGLATHAQAAAALASFKPLAHRMEFVGERRGVRYYDDSKATNVDSVVAGIDGFPRPFVLIAGGRDKGGSYAPMVEALGRNQCRRVVTIGEAAPLIEAALSSSKIPVERAATLPAAVEAAARVTGPGDAVLLSPACSSFDMFTDYKHRGRVFREAVEGLPA